MSESASPPLSIGLPVYNGERYLPGAIESLLSQTYTDFELIICDNASTDGTEDICHELSSKDSRISYQRHPINIGANGNFNAVLALARAPYFKWAAHDDLCRPDYLKKCVEVLDDQPQIVLCHTRAELIDSEGRTLPPGTTELISSSGQAVPLPFGGRPDAPYPDRAVAFSDHRARRFTDVLVRTRWCFEIFGVIRTAALRRTGQQQNFYGTDKVILAELSLAGRFSVLDELLWLRRCHEEQSGLLNEEDRAGWSKSDAKGDALPAMQMLRAYNEAVRRADMPFVDRLGCWAGIGVMTAQPDRLRRLLPGPRNFFGLGRHRFG